MKIKLRVPSYIDHSLLDNDNNVELPENSTVVELFVLLKLPKKLYSSQIYLINGMHKELDFKLTEGDKVVFFPILAGG